MCALLMPDGVCYIYKEGLHRDKDGATTVGWDRDGRCCIDRYAPNPVVECCLYEPDDE